MEDNLFKDHAKEQDVVQEEEVQEVEEVKEEPVTAQESKAMARAFFEDDEKVTLRDGRVYQIQPAALKSARELMSLLENVNTEITLLNFLPNPNSEKSAENLIKILKIAFENYPHVDEEYINNYIDLNLASEIINIVLGLNGIKKNLGN